MIESLLLKRQEILLNMNKKEIKRSRKLQIKEYKEQLHKQFGGVKLKTQPSLRGIGVATIDIALRGLYTNNTRYVNYNGELIDVVNREDFDNEN